MKNRHSLYFMDATFCYNGFPGGQPHKSKAQLEGPALPLQTLNQYLAFGLLGSNAHGRTDTIDVLAN